MDNGQDKRRLATSNEVNANTINETPFMLIRCGRDLRFQFVSRSYAEMFGRRPEEVVGLSIAEIIGKPAMETLLPHIQKTLQGDRVEFERRVETPSAGTRFLQIVYIPEFDRNGDAQGWIGALFDITDRKRAEEALHDSEQRLYSLIQAVNQAKALSEIYEAALEAILQSVRAHRASILFKDDDGVMRFKAWRGLSDEYRRAVEGHSPWGPDEPDPQPICMENVLGLEDHLRSIIEGEGIGALGFIPITYEGKLLGKFMLYYNQPHHFVEAELRLAQSIASQVAFAVHRRRDEERLERLVRERTSRLSEMIGELQHVSYAITHDMRAPLRAMNAFAALMLDELSTSGQPSTKLHESCRRIITSASRLDKLIQDSLDYTKAVLQELPLHRVELSKLLPSVIETYPNLQAEKANIQIVDPLPVVLGEESLLTQCFSNLLGNAVKFVAAGNHPQIQVRVRQTNGTARITIQDNGIGIPAQAQQRLFGMFQRLTNDYEGTGIGLAIVRKVVERMGGKVGVESTPGKGSEFWVELRKAPETTSFAPVL